MKTEGKAAARRKSNPSGGERRETIAENSLKWDAIKT